MVIDMTDNRWKILGSQVLISQNMDEDDDGIRKYNSRSRVWVHKALKIGIKGGPWG